MKSQRSLGRVAVLALSIGLGLGGMSCADDEDAVGPSVPAVGGAEAEAGAGGHDTAGVAGVTGGGGADPDPLPVRVRVSGSAQKGPLVAGSSVDVFGLDSELEPTGTVFPSQTEDSLGSFDVSGNLTNPLVEVVVQGAFYDELTSSLSETSIVLRALAAATPDTDLRVNLLTTISKNRIRYLVRRGQEFDAAVAQAEDEVLRAFGIEDDGLQAFTAMDITGSAASDAALIALSAILLQYADDHSDSEGEKVAQLGLAISTLASDLEEDGVLNHAGLRRGIPAAAVRLDVAAVTENLQEIYSRLGQSISVPDLQPFVATVKERSPWQFSTPLPVARAGHCACVVGDRVYVIGGVDAGDPLETVFQYDLATQLWEPRAQVLARRGYASCSVVDGLIYVFGGSRSGNIEGDRVEAYDPAEDTWTNKATMPLPRARHTSTTINGKVYLLGDGTDRVDVYDPAEDAWEPAGFAPTTLHDHASAAVSGKLYVFGGTDGNTPSSSVYQYDPVTDAWTPRAPMNRAKVNTIAVALGGRIYVIDGNGGTTDEYDPETDTWTTKAGMLVAKSSSAGVLLGDLVYVIGGRGEAGPPPSSRPYLEIVETYDPTKDE